MVTVTKYVWDPVFDCVSHELDENNAVKAVYHNEPLPYGGVLSQRRGTTSHYHHHDALGSTRLLTDSSGNVTDTYLYDAWGNPIASSGTTVNPFRWVGRYGYYQDASTGLVYVRARMYQPTVARWSSSDAIHLSEFYRYTEQQPGLKIDPSGNISVGIRDDSDIAFWGLSNPLTLGMWETQVVSVEYLENKKADYRLIWRARIPRANVPDRRNLDLEEWQYNKIETFIGVFSFEEVPSSQNPEFIKDVQHIPEFKFSKATHVSIEDKQSLLFLGLPLPKVCIYRQERHVVRGFNPAGTSVPKGINAPTTAAEAAVLLKSVASFEFHTSYTFIDLNECGPEYVKCCAKSGKCILESLTTPWGRFDKDATFPPLFEANFGIYR